MHQNQFVKIGVIASLCLRPKSTAHPPLAGRPALSPRPDLPSPAPPRRVPRVYKAVCQGVPVCKAGRGVCRDIASKNTFIRHSSLSRSRSEAY